GGASPFVPATGEVAVRTATRAGVRSAYAIVAGCQHPHEAVRAINNRLRGRVPCATSAGGNRSRRNELAASGKLCPVYEESVEIPAKGGQAGLTALRRSRKLRSRRRRAQARHHSTYRG